MKVDYHIHTLCSDGIYTVREVIQKVIENNITSFSITDHDSISGIKLAKKLSENKLDFITGLEITCCEITIDKLLSPISIHLLGYNFDEDSPKLVNILEARNESNRKVFENLSKELSLKKYNISISEVPISCGSVLQLCDILNYTKKKYPDLSLDIINLINSYSVNLTDANISIKDGIDAIHNAGGKAIWAHPFIGYYKFKKFNLSKNDIEIMIEYLINCGIDGIEANYLDFNQLDRDWLKQKAITNNLMYTSGSDFHGSSKRNKMGIDIV